MPPAPRVTEPIHRAESAAWDAECGGIKPSGKGLAVLLAPEYPELGTASIQLHHQQTVELFWIVGARQPPVESGCWDQSHPMREDGLGKAAGISVDTIADVVSSYARCC